MHSRIERVLDRMRVKGLSQMIVADPMSIRYLSGVDIEPFERLFILYLRDDGSGHFFLNRLFTVPQTEFQEHWYSDTDDPIRELAQLVQSDQPLGIDKVWPARFLIPLMQYCPNMPVLLASDCVDDCRAIKDSEEIGKMKRASAINDQVMEEAASYVRVGMTEKELAAFIRKRYRELGCQGESFTTIVSFGANAADPHHEPDDTILEEGQCVLIDMGCIKDHYCSDMTRTYFCGTADPEQTAVHDLVREANERAIRMIRPGVRFCDIDAAARSHIEEAGYGPNFTHRLGHFIGQTDHEQGDVSSTNTSRTEAGMIFSIEPGVYLPGKFGVRIEDLVLVTEDGYELLNHVAKEWKIVGV